MSSHSHVRAELLAPEELDAAIASVPVAYMPFGTLEYHGPHLPIGVDGLTAAAVCRNAAAIAGGIVLPTFFYGLGGTHGTYPWTIMLDGPEAIGIVVRKTLQRLQDLGVRICLIFSGHFAPEQLTALGRLRDEWMAHDKALRVLVSSVEMQLADMPVPDHAGVFETTLVSAVYPDLVHLDRLPSIEITPDPDRGEDSFGPQRHDRTHPLRGIIGPDPRHTEKQKALALLDAVTRAVLDDVDETRGVDQEDGR
jgi:creatinine amidohydrolase